MPLGVIACDKLDTDAVCAELAAQGTEVLRLGALPSLTVSTFTGLYMGLNLSRLPEGRLDDDLGLVLSQERGVREVVSAGCLNGLLRSLHTKRVTTSRGWDELAALDRKRNALALEAPLQDAGIQIRWLREIASGMAAGEGPLNAAAAPAPEMLRAALARAVAQASRERIACAWIDNGQTGVATYDTDEILERLEDEMFPPGRRIMVKVATRPDHSPLDPPLMGEPTVRLARKAKVSAILIDAERGLISAREETLAQAEEAGIAVIGVRPPRLLS